MRNPSDYLKMRVLGAIDMAEGDTQSERIKAVAAMTFTDEDGSPRQFTWRTIETWLMRYNKHGVTALAAQGRSDKGKLRKVTLEEVMESPDQEHQTVVWDSLFPGCPATPRFSPRPITALAIGAGKRNRPPRKS